MNRLALIALVLLAACARPLSPGETAFAATLFGKDMATEKVRVAPFPALSRISAKRPPRPRLACRERIWPPEPADKGPVTTFTAAFVSFNRVNIANALFLPDYLPRYPEKMSLPAAMLIGHELVHVWQWQNRDRTGYHPLKAAAEHRPGKDPYLLEFSQQSRFLDFPYEQQGAIVEEYICCRSLDPLGNRTARLHAMLSAELPLEQLSALPKTDAVLPWKDVKTAGIRS